MHMKIPHPPPEMKSITIKLNSKWANEHINLVYDIAYSINRGIGMPLTIVRLCLANTTES